MKALRLGVAPLLLGTVGACAAWCVAYANRPRWWWSREEVNPETIDHLLAVGAHKPLGYVSWDALSENHLLPHETARRFEKAGFGTKLIEPSVAKFPWGALYVFDRQALQDLLDRHRDVIVKAAWPVDAESFVHRVSMGRWVNPERSPRLYRLIGRAFNDARFAFV